MKKYFIIGISILIIILAILISIIVLKNNDDLNNDPNCSTLHISPKMCKAMFLVDVSPEDFCKTKGKNTFLENKYVKAKVDKDGCLILTVKNEVISEWKNTFMPLHVLQCIFGDTRDIGITVDYSMDFMDFMKNAHTCGFEISEDFTKVIQSPEDNPWYFPFTSSACVIMQVFEGKTCSEMKLEHVLVDENGQIIETTVSWTLEDVSLP